MLENVIEIETHQKTNVFIYLFNRNHICTKKGKKKKKEKLIN